MDVITANRNLKRMLNHKFKKMSNHDLVKENLYKSPWVILENSTTFASFCYFTCETASRRERKIVHTKAVPSGFADIDQSKNWSIVKKFQVQRAKKHVRIPRKFLFTG